VSSKGSNFKTKGLGHILTPGERTLVPEGKILQIGPL
jgi:hypothetical protein